MSCRPIRDCVSPFNIVRRKEEEDKSVSTSLAKKKKKKKPFKMNNGHSESIYKLHEAVCAHESRLRVLSALLLRVSFSEYLKSCSSRSGFSRIFLVRIKP